MYLPKPLDDKRLSSSHKSCPKGACKFNMIGTCEMAKRGYAPMHNPIKTVTKSSKVRVELLKKLRRKATKLEGESQ